MPISCALADDIFADRYGTYFEHREGATVTTGVREGLMGGLVIVWVGERAGQAV